MPKHSPLSAHHSLILQLSSQGHGPSTIVEFIPGQAYNPESIRAYLRRHNLVKTRNRPGPQPNVYWTDSELMFVWEACLQGRSYWHMADRLSTYPHRIQRLCSQLEISNHRKPGEARAMDKFQPEVEPGGTTLPPRLCLQCRSSFCPSGPWLFRCDPCKAQGLGEEGWGFATKGSRRKSSHMSL